MLVHVKVEGGSVEEKRKVMVSIESYFYQISVKVDIKFFKFGTLNVLFLDPNMDVSKNWFIESCTIMFISQTFSVLLQQ